MENLQKENIINICIEPRLNKESMDIISKKLHKCVYQIDNNQTGFFTKIPYKSNLLPVLITNNHSIGEEQLTNDKTIALYFNNKKDYKYINLNNERKRYTNEILDLTIIELKKNDNINEYLELDDEIINAFKNNVNDNNYKLIVKKLNTKNCDYISNKCIEQSYNKNNSSIIPLLSPNNYKITGIYNFNANDYNKADSLIYSIYEFDKIENNLLIKKFNEITFIHKIIKGETKIKIFSHIFVENNKDKCKIYINGKEQEICEYYEIKKNKVRKETLVIKLKEIKKITDMSCMFCDIGEFCKSLVSLPNISKLDTLSVTNLSAMFGGCSSLEFIPKISNWNTINVIDISHMFACCLSLTTISDISKWDTRNVVNMNNLFGGCLSLEFLPDISKWDTSNVKNMNFLFCRCEKLLLIPDISKWNISNVDDLSYMFSQCGKLQSLPDISRWDTSNVDNMSYMFFKCSSLSSLPDISKWNTSKVTNMDLMFAFSSITYLPDISKWNTNKLIYRKDMIKGCSELIVLPYTLDRAFFKS